MYTYDEIYSASLKYFEDDELAAGVFAGKYSLADRSGMFHEKTPEDMHKRLASEFSRISQPAKLRRDI
jgi:ribonucleoside-diphosphate reductase alpha chain